MNKIYVYNIVTRLKKPELVQALAKSSKQFNYEVVTFDTPPKTPEKNDILVIWNRHVGQDAFAKNFERVGAKVLTFENPYIPFAGEKWFSVGLGYHNNLKYALKKADKGARWKSFNREIKPWKSDNKGYVLVTTQAKTFNSEGLGLEGVRQPSGWDLNVIKMIKSYTDRPILFRPHPNGRGWDFDYIRGHAPGLKIADPKVPLKEQLQDAYCTVLWNSNSATESLIEGIPVMCHGPCLFMMDAANKGLLHLANPKTPNNRKELLEQMAWCQYSLAEIESGFFLDTLLKYN